MVALLELERLGGSARHTSKPVYAGTGAGDGVTAGRVMPAAA